MSHASVALFVDGDNIPSRCAAHILKTANKLGPISVCRTYVDSGHLKDWEAEPDFRIVHSGIGKNSTDILLCIDAMELSRAEHLTHFVIASGDRDFRHLAQRLKEFGKSVIGIGPVSTDKRFQRACSKFLSLPVENGASVAKKSTAVPAAPELDADRTSDILEKVKRTILNHGKGHKRITLAQLGQKMSQSHQITKQDLPEKNWGKYLGRFSDQFLVEGSEVELVAKKP